MKISQKRLKEVIVEEIEKLQTENSPSEATDEASTAARILDWVSQSWLFGTDDARLWKAIEDAARERALGAVSPLAPPTAREGGE